MDVEGLVKTEKKMPLRQRSIIHLILVSGMIKEHIAQALKPFEVSRQQFNVLRILRGQLGQPANLSTLNERMVTKMSNTTRLVDKLLAKKYVNRCICKHNRRKIEITITPLGLEVLQQMDKEIAKVEADILKKLSDEDLKTLNTLLDKF